MEKKKRRRDRSIPEEGYYEDYDPFGLDQIEISDDPFGIEEVDYSEETD